MMFNLISYTISYICTNTDKDWQAQHSLNLYHRAMDPVISEIKELEIVGTALSTIMVCPTC